MPAIPPRSPTPQLLQAPLPPSLQVQTGVFMQALAERLYSKQEDLLPHLEALFPEPRPEQMQRCAGGVVDVGVFGCWVP